VDFANLPKNSIGHDSFDRLSWEEIFEKSPDLRKLHKEGTELLKTFTYLQEDVFFSLYKPWPEFLAEDKISPECSLNHREMSHLLESPAYKELHEYTRLDDLGSGLGTKALLEEVVRRFKEDKALREAAEKANQAAEQQQKADSLQQMLEEMLGNQESPDPQAVQKLQQEIQQHQQVASQAAAQVEKMAAAAQSQFRRAVSAAAEKARDECEKVDAVLTAWGLNQGQFQRLPYEKKLEIVKILLTQQKFKKMTALVGRLRNLALASRKAKLDQFRVELHGITVGDDVTRALPQELAALRRPALKRNLYRKLYEKQLLQYELTHRDKAGRGPVVCLIDGSGSMGGLKEEWVKAVAMGLLEIAIKDRRAFAYAVFGSAQDPLATGCFAPGERDPLKIINMVTAFWGGGTDFEKPLSFAAETIKESAFNKADVVMITDGECRVSSAFLKNFLEIKKTREFAVYSVLLGLSPRELERWSDQVWTVNDLLNETASEEIYKAV